MKAENRIILERVTGRIEGLAFCIESKGISKILFDTAKAIVSIIEDESEDDAE